MILSHFITYINEIYLHLRDMPRFRMFSGYVCSRKYVLGIGMFSEYVRSRKYALGICLDVSSAYVSNILRTCRARLLALAVFLISYAHLARTNVNSALDSLL